MLVHRHDRHEHAIARQVLAVAQDDVVDADAEAVDVDVVGGRLARRAARLLASISRTSPSSMMMTLSSGTPIDRASMRVQHEMAVLAVDRDEVLRA